MADNIIIRDGNNLPETMRTTEIGGVHVPHHIPAGYDPVGDKLLVGTARDRFFDNFHAFDTATTWEVVQTGPGMAITGPLGGGAAGSSPYLNINSGVTDASRTVLLSRDSFTMPLDLRYQISASQRIANNRLIIGFVQVDDAGAIVTDTTYSTAPEILNARNAVFQVHDGTVATTGQLRVRAAGSALDTLANAFGAGFTTVATGTGPNFIPATTFGLTMERDAIQSRAYGQNVTTNTGGQFAYNRLIPNPTRRYKLIIIVENNGVPASATDWRLHLINILDSVRFDVGARYGGTNDLSKAMPVTGTVTATVAAATITGGTVAEDAAAGTSPLLVGGVVRTTVAPTTLVNGDAARATMTPGAALVVKEFSVPETDWQIALPLTTTTAQLARAAGAAGVRNYVTGAQFSNSGAAAVDVQILDGVTVLFQATVAPGGFIAPSFKTPLRGSAATAVNVNLSAAGTVRANLQGFQAV